MTTRPKFCTVIPVLLTPTPPFSITIGDSAVEMSAEARNLGVLFEDNLSMSKQVSNICRAGWACIRRIGKDQKVSR